MLCKQALAIRVRGTSISLVSVRSLHTKVFNAPRYTYEREVKQKCDIQT
jgi:hypothetical protein